MADDTLSNSSNLLTSEITDVSSTKNRRNSTMLDVMKTIEKLKSYTKKIEKGEDRLARLRRNLMLRSKVFQEKISMCKTKQRGFMRETSETNDENVWISQDNNDDGASSYEASIRAWTPRDVYEWVLEQTSADKVVADLFLKEEINGFMLVQINDRQLEQIGIENVETRRCILHGLDRALGIANPTARKLDLGMEVA